MNTSHLMRCLVWLLVAVTGCLAGCSDSTEPPESSETWDLSFMEDQGVDPDTEDQGADLDESPPPIDFGLPPGADTGDPCTTSTECLGGACFLDPEWPEGYCTTDGCTLDAQCGFGSVCLYEEDVSYCVRSCEEDADCRPGYSCTSLGPSEPLHCMPTPRAADGDACLQDEDCGGGTCITEAESGWTGGYCTTTNCTNREDCSRFGGVDNRCLVGSRPPICVRMCFEDSGCREGYLCNLIEPGLGFCSPKPEVLTDDELDSYPIAITCEASEGREAELDWTIQESTTAYMLVPFARDERTIRPRGVLLPDGTSYDFQGARSFLLGTNELFDWLAPMIVPFLEVLADDLVAGPHSMELLTDSSELCHYVLEESTPGTTLDLNIYLVGVPNLTAANAAQDEDMSQVLDTVGAVYGQAGVTLGEVRFFELGPEDTQRFSVPRGEVEMAELVSRSQPPGPTRDDVLSLNIFYVRSLGSRGGVLGISLGLPGPAGLHGSKSSGVVLTSEFMGATFEDNGTTFDGNEFTGLTLAHEAAHYLGLFHTSETSGRSFDPLQDTPECRESSLSQCPDITNLMFPVADIQNSAITPQQAAVLLANPLTKD